MLMMTRCCVSQNTKCYDKPCIGSWRRYSRNLLCPDRNFQHNNLMYVYVPSVCHIWSIQGSNTCIETKQTLLQAEFHPVFFCWTATSFVRAEFHCFDNCFSFVSQPTQTLISLSTPVAFLPLYKALTDRNWFCFNSNFSFIQLSIRFIKLSSISRPVCVYMV